MKTSSATVTTALRDRDFRGLALILAAMGLALLALFAAAGHSLLANLADDAFFFHRYAVNFADTRKFSWIAGGPAEYGATSQLFQIVGTIFHFVFPRLGELNLPLTSMIAGFLSIATMVTIAWLCAPRGTAPLWRSGIALAIGGLQPKLADHFFSGMETTFSVFIVSVLVILLLTATAAKRFSICCLFVPLVYLARPEAALIPGCAALALLAAQDRKSWLEPTTMRWIGIGGGLVVAQWLLFWLVYRTPVPIPFFLKSYNTAYASTAVREFEFGNVNELFQLWRSSSIIIFFAILAVAILLARDWRRHAWSIGLAAGAAAFVLFGVVGNRMPITSGGARFLVPVLPVLVYLAAYAAWEIWLLTGKTDSLPIGRTTVLAALATSLVLQAPPMLGAMARNVIIPAVSCQFRCWTPTARTDALMANIKGQNKWGALLPHIAKLPPTCSVADTEVGAVGGLNWQRPWLDYSGLNYLDLVKRRSATEQLLKDLPDFAFLDRILWYWGATAEQQNQLKAQYRPLPLSADDKNVLYVRKASSCAQSVP